LVISTESLARNIRDRIDPRTFWAISARFARRHPIGAAGLIIILVVSVLVALANFIAPFPFDRTISPKLLPLFSDNNQGKLMILGSDELGRDILSRLLHGGRTSLMVGILSPLLGVAAGTLLGIASAYFGGLVDLIVQRFVDTLIMVPGLVVAMAITVVFGFSPMVVIIALSVNMVGGTSRVVRSHALSLTQMQFIEGGKAIGAGNWRIMLRYLVPNSLAVSLVLFTVGIGNAIIAESALSFLGLGIQPPTPSWGNMLSNAQLHFDQGPHVAIIPGLTITLVVLAVNLFGDSVRDAVDPRLRGRR
jgi:peptide/nickel transport system permease protein